MGETHPEEVHVLIVDDEPQVTDVTSRMLKRFGYAAVCSSTADHALARVQEAPARFACVLLDLTMPGMTTTDALDALRAVAPNLPVILCSGQSAAAVMEAAGGRPFCQVLTKPFSSGDLRQAIEHALGTVAAG